MFLFYWQQCGTLDVPLKQLGETTNLYSEAHKKQSRFDKYISLGLCLLSAAHLLNVILYIVELLLGKRRELALYPDVCNSDRSDSSETSSCLALWYQIRLLVMDVPRLVFDSLR